MLGAGQERFQQLVRGLGAGAAGPPPSGTDLCSFTVGERWAKSQTKSRTVGPFLHEDTQAKRAEGETWMFLDSRGIRLHIEDLGVERGCLEESPWVS